MIMWEEYCEDYADQYKGNFTFEEAKQLAQNTVCTENATLTDNYSYNPNSKTGWIDLKMDNPKKGCNPACVVSEVTKKAEINWRCTGLMS